MVGQTKIEGNGLFDAGGEERLDDQERFENEDGTDDAVPVRNKLAHYRYKVGQLVDNDKFQLLVIFLIVVNAALMGVQALDFVHYNDELGVKFNKVDLGFLWIFTVELCLQFFAKGFYIFLDGWLFFDFAVVVFSWVSELSEGAELQVLRAFRIFRALRLITRIKVMRDLVEGLISTLPHMSAIFFLLSIFIYIFGVMFTTMYSDIDEEFQHLEVSGYFQRLDKSIFTLFQLLTMDGWVDITREMMIIDKYAYIPFVIYVIIAGFIFFNLIIAVLCDAIAEQSEEEERVERLRKSTELQRLIDELKMAQEKTLHTIEYLLELLQLSVDTTISEKQFSLFSRKINGQ